MILKKEKAMDLLIRYLKFTKGKGPIKEYTFYLAERTRGILLDAVTCNE